jgi:hypothetical protein
MNKIFPILILEKIRYYLFCGHTTFDEYTRYDKATLFGAPCQLIHWKKSDDNLFAFRVSPKGSNDMIKHKFYKSIGRGIGISSIFVRHNQTFSSCSFCNDLGFFIIFYDHRYVLSLFEVDIKPLSCIDPLSLALHNHIFFD